MTEDRYRSRTIEDDYDFLLSQMELQKVTITRLNQDRDILIDCLKVIMGYNHLSSDFKDMIKFSNKLKTIIRDTFIKIGINKRDIVK